MPDTVLSPLERRVVGNLSIPRNVEDLAAVLRADPGCPANPNGEHVSDLLAELKDAGLVLNLGAHEDLGKLAASLERKRGAVAMHDDKARNYVGRVSGESAVRAGRAWRAEGDLWLYTDAAHELLTGPIPGLEAPELDVAAIELLILSESKRVAHELGLSGEVTDEDARLVDADGAEVDEPIADRLLPEEFRAWVETIAADCEARTGKRPRNLPIAGGSYGDATELLVLAADAGGTAYGETSPTYGALTTVAVTDADTFSTITRAAYTGYADKSIALADYNAPSAGNHTNLNAITWAGATAGSSTCIGFARGTAAGSGRLIRYAAITSVIVSAVNTPASIAAGQLSESLN